MVRPLTPFVWSYWPFGASVGPFMKARCMLLGWVFSAVVSVWYRPLVNSRSRSRSKFSGSLKKFALCSSVMFSRSRLAGLLYGFGLNFFIGGILSGVATSPPSVTLRLRSSARSIFSASERRGRPRLRLSGCSPDGGGGGGEELVSLSLSFGSLGFLASSSFWMQSRQTKWKSSFSAASCEMPRQALCCQTLHFSQARLCVPSSWIVSEWVGREGRICESSRQSMKVVNRMCERRQDV